MLYLYGYKGMKLGIFSGCDLPLFPSPPHQLFHYGQNSNDRLPLLDSGSLILVKYHVYQTYSYFHLPLCS